MSTRQELVDALVARLSAVPELGTVAYWKAARVAHGESATSVRDVAARFEQINTSHEHRVRVEVESYVFGDDLGRAMNARLAVIFEALRAPLQATTRSVVRPVEARSEVVGDGQEAGVVGVVFDVVYRSQVWDV